MSWFGKNLKRFGQASVHESDADRRDCYVTARWEPPATYFLLALWFAVLSGLSEVVILMLRQKVWNQPINAGTDVIWMIPLANIILFSIPGVAFFCTARHLPKFMSPQYAILVYTFLSIIGLLAMIPKLHVLAAIVLAGGLAAQISRLVSRHPKSFLTLIRFTMGPIPLVIGGTQQIEPPRNSGAKKPDDVISRRRFVVLGLGAVAGLGFGGRALRSLEEQRMIRRLGPSKSAMPNVLLIVLDTVRAQSLSLYGYKRPTTPHMERLAQAGLYFQEAYSTAPWTLPAHGSLFTGRLPHELSTDFETALDNTYPTLAEVLSGEGYSTAGFVANTEYCSYEFGLNRGFVHYEDYSISTGEIIRSSSLARMSVHSRLRQMFGYRDLLGRKSAAQISQDFMRWLSRRDEDRPFFAFLNYFDAHDPYLPPQEFALRFSSDVPRGHLPAPGTKLPVEEVRQLNLAYDGAIAYMDEQVGALLNQLKHQGTLQNTVVIITSDHGEQFGEHGLLGHANSLYLPLLHVPLLFLLPGMAHANERISTPVSLRDVPATVLDLLGLKPVVDFPGRSLTQYWRNSQAIAAAPEPLLAEATAGVRQPKAYPTSKGEMHSLLLGAVHYIRHSDGVEELYDLENDLGELNNLGELDAYREILEQFRARLKLVLS